MLKMVDGTGIIGVDMVCPLGGAVSPPQPPNYDRVEMEGVGSLMLPNSLKAPLERLELIGNSTQGENPAPDNPKEIKSAGKWNKATGKYEIDIILNGSNLWKEDSMIRGHLTANGEIVYKEDGSSCIWTVTVPRDGKYAVRIEKESVGGLYFTKIFNDKISEPYVRLNPGQKGGLTLKKGENKIQASSTSALRPTGNEKVMLSYGDQEPPTYEAYQEPQPLILTSDRPITKWDKLVEQGGQYGWLYGGKIIDSYNSEPIDTEYMSSTGQLSIGATVLYRLKEPEFTPLSQEEQTQLRNLHSYNGTTHVFVDSGEVPCGIKLTYRKEK